MYVYTCAEAPWGLDPGLMKSRVLLKVEMLGKSERGEPVLKMHVQGGLEHLKYLTTSIILPSPRLHMVSGKGTNHSLCLRREEAGWVLEEVTWKDQS